MCLAIWPSFHLMLSKGVTRNIGFAKPRGGTGFRVQLPEPTYRYLAGDVQLEGGR